MSDTLLTYVGGWVRSAAVGPFLWFAGALLFVFVMTRNYRRGVEDAPDLHEDVGESRVDDIRIRWPGLETHTFLTTRRIVQTRFSWFLSKRKIKAISLDEVHSIVWRRYANWFLLLLGLYVLNIFNPAALLLLLFGLQSRIYSVRFATPFAQMPYTRVVVTTARRSQLARMRVFHQHALQTWSRMIAEKRLASPVGVPLIGASLPPSARPVALTATENDFSWGAPLLFYVCTFMLIAFAQRVSGPHISFDDAFYGPLYLGIVAGVAGRNRRDGLWLAVLAPLAIFTVKFPSSGLLGMLVSDGGSPLYEEYSLILLALVAVAASAAFLSRVTSWLAPIAVLWWLLVPPISQTGTVLDSSLLSKVLAAAGWALAFSLADREVRRLFARGQPV